MAAPANKTIKDLNGKWVMNRKFSDPSEPVLALQGVSWLTRKAVGLATVTQSIRQQNKTTDEESGTIHIDIDQTATGSIKGTSEHRTLDWTPRPHSDWLFGDVMGKSRFSTIAKVLEDAREKGGNVESDARFLTTGWLPETLAGDVVESWVVNEKAKWTVWQIWGFAEVEGARWLVRRYAVRRTDREEVVLSRMAYEWVGEV
ncbi:hypothetical protein CC80DRAFT_467944 [Byssothecium circinans]|uniref:Lccl domain-containing protein n=1 Tax=Byssothecium circinans TaxID=147558 RepID=A0A6A5U507_9PLEO|nr:hypothetical protein CC80DRAFT_467944 [Byssothecium circinans]